MLTLQERCSEENLQTKTGQIYLLNETHVVETMNRKQEKFQEETTDRQNSRTRPRCY